MNFTWMKWNVFTWNEYEKFIWANDDMIWYMEKGDGYETIFNR